MVRALCLLLFLEVACFGQALYTFRDPAFLGAVQPSYVSPANITNGLTAYWKLNEGTGLTASDSTANGLNLTLTPNNAWCTNGYPNTNAIAMSVPPAYLSSSANALFTTGTNDFSVSLWFNKTNQWGDPTTLMLTRDSVSANYHFILSSGTLLQLTVFSTNDTVVMNGPSTAGLTLNSWHFLCVSRIGTNYSMWLDGSQVGSTSSTNITTVPGGNPTAYLGTFSIYYAFGGMIEEVMFRNGYGLTSNDVQYLLYTYYGGLQPIPPAGGPNITNGLTLYLKMDEASGATLYDSSTNGINGSTTLPTFRTDHGRSHKYALNCGSGGYAASRNNVFDTYQFLTNDLWSIGLWFCHTNATWGTEFLVLGNVSGRPEWKTALVGANANLIFLPKPGSSQYLDGGQVSGFPQNKWVFLVVTKNANEHLISGEHQHIWYKCMDGSITTTTNYWFDGYDAQTGPVTQFVFGSTFGGYKLNGYMEEFRLHCNYCLSSNEVRYLYHTYYNEP